MGHPTSNLLPLRFDRAAHIQLDTLDTFDTFTLVSQVFHACQLAGKARLGQEQEFIPLPSPSRRRRSFSARMSVRRKRPHPEFSRWGRHHA